MQKVLNLYKPMAWTPLRTIQEFKKREPEYSDIKMAYAGRLDPMAHGVLLVLVGDECKNREDYQNLDKEYEFEVLFGLSTDTYDILGVIDSIPFVSSLRKETYQIIQDIKKILPDFTGRIKQTYPPYSSKAVNGKKLFQWAKEVKLNKIEIPTHEVEVYSLDLLGSYDISFQDLGIRIKERIKKIEGDFRQEEILTRWNDFFKQEEDSDRQQDYRIFQFKARVGSGTYIRSICHEIGKRLGYGAIAFNICRTSVDGYSLGDSIQVM